MMQVANGMVSIYFWMPIGSEIRSVPIAAMLEGACTFETSVSKISQSYA
jgi:hypothetical protein